MVRNFAALMFLPQFGYVFMAFFLLVPVNWILTAASISAAHASVQKHHLTLYVPGRGSFGQLSKGATFDWILLCRRADFPDAGVRRLILAARIALIALMLGVALFFILLFSLLAGF